MINLLPPKKKEELLLEKNKKLVIILGITLLIPLICLILFLLSIRFYILAEVNSEQAMLDQTRERYQTPDFLAFNNIIKNDNKILLQLKSFYKKEIYVSDVLKITSDVARPKNLYFTDLALSRGDNQKVKVTITGFSSSREDLLTFQKNIEDYKGIENPYFSPESWVSPTDVTFYLTFEVSK